MIELVKTWLSMIIILGIAFTLIRMITPNTSFKKYVYSMIGVVTVITIITPVISKLAKGTITDEISKSLEDILAVETMSSNYENYAQISSNNVREEFKSRVEEDIINKLKKKINQEIEVNVQVSDAYNIEKIEITLSKATDVNVKKYLSNEYDVLEENIIVSNGGSDGIFRKD